MEGGISTKFHAGGFLKEVFSWSLHDIKDENLYKEKVKMIPDSFESVDQYCMSYVYPLLEETRAQLCSSMETMCGAPFAQVVSLTRSVRHGESFYDTAVDYWRNTKSDRGKEPYKTLPGDILFLTDVNPETVYDLERAGTTWTFASVKEITEDESGDSNSSTHFKLKMSNELEVTDGMQKSLFAVFLMSITSSRRIWNALHLAKNQSIMNEALSMESVFDGSCIDCSEYNDSRSETFLMDLSSELNEPQCEAVQGCITRISCSHKPGFDLIWGPPGTGKTKTISFLLLILLRMKYRVLSCAPTNVAITEVAKLVLKLLKADSKNDVFCSSLGDILLIGNKARLKVDSDTEEIYLDCRVNSLLECFGTLTGWWYHCTSMIDFLEDGFAQYKIFAESALTQEKEWSKENEMKKNESCSEVDDCEEDKSKTFLIHARERFTAIMLPLHRCLSILCKHIPRGYLLEDNCQKILSLLGLLQSFETLLFHGDVTSESMETHEMHSKRTQCIVLLKDIRISLKGLNLPSAMNVDSVRKFCLQNARLIFSTASNSYTLLSAERNLFNVLVIDEAAQLKECESAIPLQLPGIKYAILIGDECQLRATVISKVSEEVGFGRSLFQRLSMLGHSKHLLSIQYRMHPSISCFPNWRFYHNVILDAPSVKKKSFQIPYLEGPMFGPYSFIDVFGREEKDDVGYSIRNMVEVAVVVRLVRLLHKAWSGKALSIGVISPYAAQVVAVREKIGQRYDTCNGFHVKVSSVDGFQGGEEDIIIISTVRSNKASAVGFLESYQRTNVALTRARHCLWIVGNGKTLVNSESVWEAVVRDAKNRRCFFCADEDKDLAKAILDARKEFYHLDDFLNGRNEFFRNVRWKVLFSDYFKRSFRKVPSVGRKKQILNLLLKLSSGWRPKKRNVDIICEKSSMILKQFKVESCYVICSIDIVKVLNYTQVLKAWDIVPLEDTKRLAERLDGIFQMYTDDFIDLCKEKCIEGDLEVPKTWSAASDIVKYKDIRTCGSDKNAFSDASSDRHYAENSKVSESLLLMKFYSLSSSIANHLLSDRDGRELEFPFEVTDEEMEVILFQKSSFILGRSGTGKTTVLTTKLFKKEQLHQFSNEGLAQVSCDTETEGCSTQTEIDFERQRKQTVLKQLFVTVNPRLCSASGNYVQQLKRYADGGSYSEVRFADVESFDAANELKDVPNSFVGIASTKYPLFMTFQKFLLMLDGTVGHSFFERFPRFLDLHREIANSSIALMTFIKTREVKYDKFCSVYWPRFNKKLTKRLNPSLVFTEIISYIKGGLLAGEFADGRLDRENYVMLSEGRISTLRKPIRETIYDIFESYERMKRDNGEFDFADLVIDLHNRLKRQKYDGALMDFVYIDEVQDLSMSQIALFKHICRNVSEGFVFAGDTAQTIARGIDFRFEDIRSMFYTEFVMGSKNKGNVGMNQKGQISKVFHLSQNYRTHDGVLRLAQSVIDLLYRFFPQFVDILSPETSLICGEAPTLLEHEGENTALQTIFDSKEGAGNNRAVFGAQQVIIVRDDLSKKEILEYIGKQALVLTTFECKGLEFQDVLLLNFFGSSPMKTQWRVIYEYMCEQCLFNEGDKRSFPSFDEAKDNVLCSELKQLYVAVTRTKEKLWICEDNDEVCKPMFDYWKSKSLVSVTKLDNSFAQAMGVASSSEEWKLKGYKLLQEGNYQMAITCFEKAGDLMGENWAKAAGLRADADRLYSWDLKRSENYRRQAAELFDSIGKAEEAAECFYMVKDYERAGKIYLEKCGQSALERAGDCLLLAGRYKTASDVFARAKLFSKCLSTCTKGKLFDKGLQYVQYWRRHAELSETSQSYGEKLEEKFLKNCVLHYHKLNDRRAMLKYIKAFESRSTIRTFLKSVNCLEELLSLEEEWGDFLEAARIAKLRVDVLLEADMLSKGGEFRDASNLIMLHVLASSLWSSGSQGWPLKQFSEKEKLLMKAKSSAKKHSEAFHDFICSESNMFSDDQGHFAMLTINFYHWNVSQMHQSLRGEILSARNILDCHVHLNDSKYAWEDDMVSDLSQYSEYRFSCGQVSSETLVYFWNFWKEKILNIFEYLKFKQSGRDDVNKYGRYGEFCLNYFGVWVDSDHSNSNYIVSIPGASWARELEHKVFQRNDRLQSVSGLEFDNFCRRYWCSEMTSVGMKVLDKLEVLYKTSTRNTLSNFCQSRVLFHIYNVAKFLVTTKFQNVQQPERRLLNSIELCASNFFDQVFPCDWQESLRRSMFSLREDITSTNILDEYIHEMTASRRRKLSYREIGMVAVILLGTPTITNELYARIIAGLEWNPAWTNFLMALRRQRGLTNSTCLAAAGSNNSAIVHGNDMKVTDQRSIASIDMRAFFEALKDTYNANWRMTDYISPNCFTYLIERYVFLLSHLNGSVYTTKSSFVEWLMFRDGRAASGSIYVAVESEPCPQRDTLPFILHTVRRFLLDERETIQWLRNSNPDGAKYHSPLVLRMVVVICLLQLNFRNLQDLISEVMRRDYITKLLPVTFRNTLQKMRSPDIQVQTHVLAEALSSVGNPLVILKVEQGIWRLNCPSSAIFVDMKASKGKEEILERVFPKEEAAKPTSCGTSPGRIIKSKGLTTPPPPSSSAFPENQALDVQNPSQDHGYLPSTIWETFEIFKEANIDPMGIMSESTKTELGKIIQPLTAATRELALHEHSSDESKLIIDNALKMLDEMLYDLLDSRELNVASMQKIKELGTQLCGRNPVLEPFLLQMFSSELLPKKLISKLEKEGDNPDVGEVGQGKAESSHAVDTSEPQSSNKGKHKQKQEQEEEEQQQQSEEKQVGACILA